MQCVKTFGTRRCKLCAKVLTLTRKTPQLAINKCNKVHGTCRHRPRFHRFDQSQIDANASTDESDMDERVARLSSSSASLGSTHSTGSVIFLRENQTQWHGDDRNDNAAACYAIPSCCDVGVFTRSSARLPRVFQMPLSRKQRVVRSELQNSFQSNFRIAMLNTFVSLQLADDR